MGWAIGLDLVLTYEHSCLKLRRNHRTENEKTLSHQARRNLMFKCVLLARRIFFFFLLTFFFPFTCRLTIYGLDEQRMVQYTRSTGIQSTTLGKNEEVSSNMPWNFFYLYCYICVSDMPYNSG